MTRREDFSAEAVGGPLAGWVAGSGPEVLLLHGGPGLGYAYLDAMAAELTPEFRVASFQQRGLPPSTLEGPFTIAQAVEDVIAVLDGLGWERALLAGHSWGGHLALRVAAARPDRLTGALAVDPIGVVGDGGTAAFEAEIFGRTTKAARERAQEIDERAMAGHGTGEDFMESLRLVWPAYFADPEAAPEMPPIEASIDAYSGLIGQMSEGLETVAAELAKGAIPYGVIVGASSPIPWGQASRPTAELSDRAFLDVVPGAGHFIWIEAPGRVRAALQRLHDLAT